MQNRWLENEPKETLICAVTSAADEGYRFCELREQK